MFLQLHKLSCLYIAPIRLQKRYVLGITCDVKARVRNEIATYIPIVYMYQSEVCRLGTFYLPMRPILPAAARVTPVTAANHGSTAR